MNILFLTLTNFESIYERNIYTDLLREFLKYDHAIYIISPSERRLNKPGCVIKENKSTILRLKIGNIQKTNIIEKGVSTIIIEQLYVTAIKKYFKDVKFDLVLYSTPPITLGKAVEFVKKRDNAKTYLLLKDIFPQNAVDLGILNKKGVLYWYFRHKEKNLYHISDVIGCMSKANVKYILKHNAEIDHSQVEICPNCIDVVDRDMSDKEKIEIRKLYGIPCDKTVFVYGGNLGKPQGINFMLKCLHSQRKNQKFFFLIVGDGTEYMKITQYMKKYRPDNMKLFQWIKNDDYDKLVRACDIGMIFLDHRFTIPNFPSRLLSYMQAKIPVLAVTDCNTDIGETIINGRFGWWCESTNLKEFTHIIREIENQNIKEMGERGYLFLKKNFIASREYKKIIERVVK